MHRFIDLCRAILISPECVVATSGLFILSEHSQWLVPIITRLDGAEAIKWTAGVPILVLGLLINDTRELLFPPEDESKNLLSEWPDYWRLKNRFIASLFWSFAFACIGGVSWLVGQPAKSTQALALLITALVGSGVVYWLVYAARIKIREIFRGRK
jgi:hypothetical protein